MGSVHGNDFRFCFADHLPLLRMRAVMEPSHHDGARVRVSMWLDPLAALWMAGATLGGSAAFAYGQERGALFGIVMLLLVFALWMSFALRARNAELVLRALFASVAKVESQPQPPETGVPYR